MLRLIASKAAAATIAAVAVLSTLGLVVTPAATASPAQHQSAPAQQQVVNYLHCRLHHSHNYPPGRCYLRFNRAHYKRFNRKHYVKATQVAHFRSGLHNFKPHEKVSLLERCRHGYINRHKRITHNNRHHVNRRGRLFGHFRIATNTPFGKCTVTVTGKTSGNKVRGSFRVVH